MDIIVAQVFFDRSLWHGNDGTLEFPRMARLFAKKSWNSAIPQTGADDL